MGETASQDADVEFWHRHAVVGVVLSLATVATSLLYVWMSPDRPHPEILVGILSVAGLLSAAIGALPLQRIIRHRLRPWFFASWSGTIVLLLGAGILLDGGIESPFTAMLYLPLVYAAMAYPPWATAAVSGQVLVVYVAFALADGTISGRELAMLSGLLLTGGMCAITAKIHWRAFHDQAGLSRRLAELADHDGLTGCLNHRAFHERLAQCLASAARERSDVAVAVLDLDRFKSVNDTYGHPEGDALLRRIASALRDGIRPGDSVGRLGGDEFALILPDAGLVEACALADRLRHAIADIGAGGADTGGTGVTASIGVAAAVGGREAAGHLVSRADEEAYEAKRRGGDAVQPTRDANRPPDRAVRV